MTEHFNPHSRTGSDFLGDGQSLFNLWISIHTPAQGVTLPHILVLSHPFISIHTPAQGVTKVILCSLCPSVFQSTLPHRE